MSHGLDRIISEVFEKEYISFDIAHFINDCFLSKEVSIGVFEKKMREILEQIIVQRFAQEMMFSRPLEQTMIRIFYNRIAFKLSLLQNSSKEESLKMLAETLEDLHRPKNFTVSIIADSKILQVIMPYVTDKSLNRKVNIDVKALFVDPDMDVSELQGLNIKIFDDWKRFTENISGDPGSVVLVSDSYISLDTELAQKYIFELIYMGIRVATDAKLPHIFGLAVWKELEAAIERSPVKNGETVIYLNGGISVEKPLCLENLKAGWAKSQQKNCIDCPSYEECLPERIFPH